MSAPRSGRALRWRSVWGRRGPSPCRWLRGRGKEGAAAADACAYGLLALPTLVNSRPPNRLKQQQNHPHAVWETGGGQGNASVTHSLPPGGRLRLSASLVGRHCTASVDGTYDAGARRLELDSPAELALGVSARLGRLALGLLNPLVGEAAELEGGGMVQMRVTSPEGQLPADRLQVSVDPSSFRMRSPLIGGLLHLLRHQLGGASGAGGAPRAAAGPGAAPAPRAPALFVRLSAFDAELERDGDVRFGPVGVEVAGTPGGGGGLDFSLAGTSAAGEVDMDVAVPAAALRSVARRPNLPDSACLTVPVRGSPPHLQVDWAAALGRLTALLLTSAAPPSGGGP